MKAGDLGWYSKASKKVYCKACLDKPKTNDAGIQGRASTSSSPTSSLSQPRQQITPQLQAQWLAWAEEALDLKYGKGEWDPIAFQGLLAVLVTSYSKEFISNRISDERKGR